MTAVISVDAAGMSKTDLAILKRIDELRPKELAGTEEVLRGDKWVLVIPSDEPGQDDGWLIADREAVPDTSSSAARLDLAVVAAAGIKKEIKWYFSERDSRLWLWSRRCDPTSRPCARTVFARSLQRLADIELQRSDGRRQIDAWCVFLRRVLLARVFSSSNWLWRSDFERCLEACLVRLDALRCHLNGSEPHGSTVACPTDRQEVLRLVARREEHGGYSEDIMKSFTIYRHITRFRPPGFAMLSRLHTWAVRSSICAASVSIGGQVLVEARAYSNNEIDERTLAEDVVVSTGSAAAFAFARFASGLFVLGSCPLAFLADTLAPSVLALATGAVVRSVGERLYGSRDSRALRCAYKGLGLSPADVTSYSSTEVEAQLAWCLQQHDADSKRLWVAYEYIRQHHRHDLRDPWDLSDTPRM